MRLALTLLVRNEADVLEANLEHHLAQGVDVLVVTDNVSDDGSRAILERYRRRGHIDELLIEPGRDFSQHRWVTRMARLAAADHGADWVMNSDVDEFWFARGGRTLAEAFASVPEHIGAVVAQRYELALRPSDDRPFWERQTVRSATPRNFDSEPLPPKLAHRGDPHVVVRQGNHEVDGLALTGELDDGRLEILHVPARSPEQFLRGLVLKAEGYERNTELPPQVGYRTRAYYQELQEARLAERVAGWNLDDAAVAEGLRSGELVEDRRLRDELRERLAGWSGPAARTVGMARVRAVVLNYNGGEHVLTCIEHLCRTEWPEDAFEIVVVDNASTDGSDERIAEQFPQVRLVRSPTNDGFPANNLAMRELDDVDHVALINNDAFVEPGWLAPLVAALDAEPDLGAACPRILFAPGFLDVELSASTFRPGGADPRTLGVQVRGVEVDGKDAWRGAQFATGFWGLEVGPGPDERFQWTADEAVLRVPVPPRRPADAQLTLRLGGPPGTAVALRCGDERAEAVLGDAGATVELALRGEPHDVVNNVGSVLVEGGYGADRGFLVPDAGQFAEPAEVFSWCGAGVLLRGHYLRHVGLFDERFFMYYEDTDLSWRGRARGWRYRYVPESTLRHVHAATSVEGSPLFTHFVERNRLLMLAKNAPASMAAWAAVHHLLVTASYVRRDVVRPALGKHRPNTELSERRLRAFAGALRLAPAILADRRAGRSRQTVADEELLAWLVPQP